MKNAEPTSKRVSLSRSGVIGSRSVRSFLAVVIVGSSLSAAIVDTHLAGAVIPQKGPSNVSPIKHPPHFTTTSPLYTQGQLFGGSNPASLCYTCEASNITGTAPPSESLDNGSGVNTLTGDYSFTNDLFGSSPGVGLPLSTTYDAQLAQAEVTAGAGVHGEFGVGWSSNFDSSVTPESGEASASATVNELNGSQVTFNESSDSGESTSCPTGDYSSAFKYTVESFGAYSTYDQWCALASVQGQFFNNPGGSMVFETDGGQSTDIYTWDGSLQDVEQYSSQNGESAVEVSYDVEPTGMTSTPPCPTTATDCIDEQSFGDDGATASYDVEALNSAGLVTQVYDPSGVSYDFTYDSSGNLTSVEKYANQTSPSTWYYVYSTSAASPNSSNLEEIYDPDSGATSSTGYSSGAAHSNSIVYNTSGSDSGMASSVTDGTGATTTYSYADACDTGQCVATNAAQQTTVTYPAQLPSPGGTAVSPVEVDSYVGGVESSTSLGSNTNAYNKETWTYSWSLGYGASNSTETITYPNSIAGGTAPTATVVLDPAGNIVSTTNVVGDVATSAYNDVSGNTFPELLWSYPGSSSNSPSDPPSGSWVYTYNTQGQVKSVTDPLGNKTTYGYYSSDYDPCFIAQPTVSMSGYSSSCSGYGSNWTGTLGEAVSAAPAGSTAFIYDYFGNVATTDVDNAETVSAGEDPQTSTASYNIMGDELWSVPPAGQTDGQSSSNPYATVTTYTPANLPLTVTKPVENTVTNSYDAALNLISSASSATATTTHFDSDNRPCYQVVAGSVQTLTSCPTPASGTGQTTVMAGSMVTSYVPGSSTVASTTDGNGYTRWDYYADLAYPSSPTEVVDSLGNEVEYTAYNDFGSACASGDISLASHQGTSSQCSSVAGDTMASYNALGNETSITDPSGNTTTNTFTNTAYPTAETSTENSLSKTTTYAYDADGNETETTNPDSTVVYTSFDPDGRPCTVSDTGTDYACDAGSGTPGVTNYVYNDASDQVATTSPALTGMSQVTASDGSPCAWSTGSTGKVECWNGAPGDGSSASSADPAQVNGLTNVAQVSGSCALLSGGTVECWDTYYQGNGVSGASLVPQTVSGLTGVTQIADSGSSICAVLSSGTAKCWGGNSYGQLGNGNNTTELSPTAVEGLSDIAQISMGSQDTCALLTTGAVDCWGNNNNDQLGNGYEDYSYSPIAVSGLSGVTEVSAGNQYACALLSGDVYCWGLDNGGQLGNDLGGLNPTPTEVSGLSGVTQVTAGLDSTCALLSTEAIDCWGYNYEGELGDGSISSSSSTPEAVSGISNAVNVSGGYGFNCAVLSTGLVDCWGAGPMGNPTVAMDTDVPVAVVFANVSTYANGQLVTSTDPNNRTLSYVYNFDGQVACVAYPVAPASSCGTFASPATASPANTIATRGYDTSGRLSTVSDWMTTNNTTTYTYGDANFPGAMTKITYPSSTSLTANYGYDSDGNLTSLSAGSAISDTWTYNHDEQVATTKINSSTSATVGYNANSQITAAANLGTSTSNDTYTVAANGEITKDVPPSGTTYSYAYNGGDELCTTTAGSSATSCGSNPSTGTTFAYTSNGQRSSATPYTSGSAGSVTYYKWNALGELCNVASASTSCGTQPTSGTSYQYGGNGLRMTATTSTTTTDSAWDTVSGGPIPLNVNDAASTSSATTTTSYLYGDLLFGDTAPLEQITTTSSGATPVFLVPNPTGVQEVVSISGTDDELAVYSVFGKQTISSGSNFTPFGFQGSYRDSTGLIYLINRYYDPMTDQFLSVDPDVSQTNQPYVFTNDDPLNAEDPDGSRPAGPSPYGEHYPPANLQTVIQNYLGSEVGVKSGRGSSKIIFYDTNDPAKEVVYDSNSNYFRIVDTSSGKEMYYDRTNDIWGTNNQLSDEGQANSHYANSGESYDSVDAAAQQLSGSSDGDAGSDDGGDSWLGGDLGSSWLFLLFPSVNQLVPPTLRGVST